MASAELVAERILSDRGYVRLRLVLINGDFLELSEYFALKAGSLSTLEYRYQWMDGSRVHLKKRWHNALRELAEIDVRLRLFERQYGMTSEEFYERFQEGELGDNADFFEWSACYDMARSVHERLQNLQTQPS